MLRVGGQQISTKTLTLFGSDVFMIGLGLAAATAVRLEALTSCKDFLSAPENLWRFGAVTLICALALYYQDMYDVRLPNRRIVLCLNIAQAVGSACLILALLYFFFPGLACGRGIALIAAPIILTLLTSWRWLLEKTGALAGRPEGVLILGTGSTGITLAREVCSRNDLRLNILGFLEEHSDDVAKPLADPGIIGGVDDLNQVVSARKVGRVVLALNDRRGSMPVRDLLHLKFAGVAVEEAHSLYERITGKIMLDKLSPSWLILSDGFRKSNWLLAAKRLLDIVAALIGLALSLPIMLLVALAIFAESGGPVIFRQDRIGLEGRAFELLKFRSMRQNSDCGGAKWATSNDPRITRVGKVIRKLRFDELPQFINVLRGDMSLVGPRPEQPKFCEMLEEQIPFYVQRHAVRPGITGWAQVKYQYGASVDDSRTKLELDLFYIKHLSIVLDLAIMFETVKVMLLGRGAQ